MQGIRDWALELETISLSNRTAFSYEVFCRLAKLIQVKSATLQRFQLAFKHLLLFEKNSRLHPIFQDFAFNFHTFSRSGKVVRKFPDFFKNSRLCTNPALCYHRKTTWKFLFEMKRKKKLGRNNNKKNVLKMKEQRK